MAAQIIVCTFFVIGPELKEIDALFVANYFVAVYKKDKEIMLESLLWTRQNNVHISLSLAQTTKK